MSKFGEFLAKWMKAEENTPPAGDDAAPEGDAAATEESPAPTEETPPAAPAEPDDAAPEGDAAGASQASDAQSDPQMEQFRRLVGVVGAEAAGEALAKGADYDTTVAGYIAHQKAEIAELKTRLVAIGTKGESSPASAQDAEADASAKTTMADIIRRK